MPRVPHEWSGTHLEKVPGAALAKSPSRGRQAAWLVRTLRRARHTAVTALNPEPMAICSSCAPHATPCQRLSVRP